MEYEFELIEFFGMILPSENSEDLTSEAAIGQGTIYCAIGDGVYMLYKPVICDCIVICRRRMLCSADRAFSLCCGGWMHDVRADVSFLQPAAHRAEDATPSEKPRQAANAANQRECAA